MSKDPAKVPDVPYTPGDGARSARSTNVFRVVNFELYAKPVSVDIFLLHRQSVICFITMQFSPLYRQEFRYHGLGTHRTDLNVGLHSLHAQQIRKPRILYGNTKRWHRSLYKKTVKMGLNCKPNRFSRIYILFSLFISNMFSVSRFKEWFALNGM